MSAAQILQHLYSLDTSSPNLSRCLYCLIRSDEEEQYLSTLQGSELTQLVDFLDEILDAAPMADDVFRRCLHKLKTICSRHAILPSSYTIVGDLARTGNDPVAFGGFSDVWEGTYNGSKVCIKHLRVSEQVRKSIEKAFYKEAIMWKRFRHPNVVAFIGVTRNPLQFVSEWMQNGTLTDYVNENPGANRIGLLLDVAEGLSYLHANHTTHGDLKGPNILVDHNGHARLTDFGFAAVVRGLTSVLVTEVQGYTARWAAPEVLGTGDRNTPEADIFAFAMVVVEVFTGNCPFSELTAMVTVAKIMDGERPDRPQEPSLTDSIWDMTCACWCQDPARRPAMTKVVGILRECYRPYAADLHLSSPSGPQPAKRAVKARTIDSTSMPLALSSAYQRINEIAEELTGSKDGPRGDHYNELSQLCTLWDTVPVSYELRGVMEQGGQAQRVSPMTEIWKGMYDGGVVALKVLRLSQGDPDIKAAKHRFCRGAVLMKQLEHNNILPFYGVSTTVSHFSLVFPWYKNGNINQYLGDNPHINPYDLLLGAAEGLLFLHSNRLVHGALRPGHILIDDNGNARLTIAAHDTSGVPHTRPWSAEDTKDCSYMAPETRPLAEYATPSSMHRRSMTIEDNPGTVGSGTIESDVYEMAMVVYEVLTGIAPYCEYRDQSTQYVWMGGIPARPHGVLNDIVWELLKKCWSAAPRDRPPITEVHRTLESRPEVVHTPQRRSVADDLPGTLKLHVHSITSKSVHLFSRQFYIKFKYGYRDYTTSPTEPNDYGAYTWNGPENWLIQTMSGQPRGQWVTLEVLVRTGVLRKDKAQAKGGFSLINSSDKQIVVVLPVSDYETIDVRMLVMAV